MSEDRVEVTLQQQEGYRFAAHYRNGTPSLITDEPTPLGGNQGPSPSQLLVTALANCLSDSLIFALGKFRQPSDGIRTEAVGLIGRNAENRMRIVGVEVTLHLGHPAAAFERLERILDQFEQFCTVSQSVVSALPITLKVLDSDGILLKG
ncbi:OsmC family protein [Halopseudomonas sabulinigri]|uniref:Peroxiredoxin n=1 Tax=Halopseudomonas sabulinigri TaxID=472181 RepID=A0ABP9ZRX7_9GAMM